MTEGMIVEWLVKTGDEVTTGVELAEVETDKIAGAIESQASGVLKRVLIDAGESAGVASLLGVIASPEVDELEIDEFVSNFHHQAGSAPSSDQSEADETQFIVFDEHRIHVRSVGSGLPVLLIHGFGGDITNWLFNQDKLADSYRVHAIDLPAHGKSSLTLKTGSVDELGNIVAGVLKDLEDDPVHVVGHSLGGSVAMYVATNNQDLVSSVNLISPSGFCEYISETFVADFLSADRRKKMQEALTRLFFDSGSVTRVMTENALRHNRIDGVIDQFRLIAESNFPGRRQTVDWRTELEKISCPVQFIWGTEDCVIPVSHAEEFLEDLALIKIDGSGHMPHMEQAKQTNRLLYKQFSAA